MPFALIWNQILDFDIPLKFVKALQSILLHFVKNSVMNTEDIQHILLIESSHNCKSSTGSCHSSHTARFTFHSAVSFCCLQSGLPSAFSLPLTGMSNSTETLSEAMLQNPG